MKANDNVYWFPIHFYVVADLANWSALRSDVLDIDE